MKNKITVIVPATSANCGPGYDSLGLACNLYNDFTFEILDTPGFALEVIGEGEDRLRAGGRNLAFLSFLKVWNEVRGTRIGLKVTMQNRIPLSRGLGSSSTAIVAGLVAANLLTGSTLPKERLLNYATEIEGHPDNVAPALLGGITISYMDRSGAHSLRFLPQKELRFIAVVPDQPLSTHKARQAIPQHIPHQDAVFNASRTALYVGALMSGNYQYLNAALEDRLHQPYRIPLITGTEAVFEAAKANGAYGAIISGAGSTLMAYADPENEYLIQNAISKLVKGKTLIVVAHRLATIQKADQILVVENGKIVGCGRQEELLSECPLYQRLWSDYVSSADQVEGGTF